MCKQNNNNKKMIRGLVVMKINQGSRANELCAEIPFFQGFSLDSNITHEYKPGSTHPKPQERTSGRHQEHCLNLAPRFLSESYEKFQEWSWIRFTSKSMGPTNRIWMKEAFRIFWKKQCYFNDTFFPPTSKIVSSVIFLYITRMRCCTWCVTIWHNTVAGMLYYFNAI